MLCESPHQDIAWRMLPTGTPSHYNPCFLSYFLFPAHVKNPLCHMLRLPRGIKSSDHRLSSLKPRAKDVIHPLVSLSQALDHSNKSQTAAYTGTAVTKTMVWHPQETEKKLLNLPKEMSKKNVKGAI